jgi:DNA-binding NtrC family response regulator
MPDEAMTCLIVEDEALIRWSIAETLSARGHTVFEAEDGASARFVIDEHGDSIDVVVLDYHLPDSSDLRLLDSIRDAIPDVVVVMMTGLVTDDGASEALAHGAHQIIGKPFNVAGLEKVLLRAISTNARKQDGDDADADLA